MRQVVGVGGCPLASGNFGGGCGASHCNQWGLCCVKVCVVIELLFWMSGVSQGFDVLDGVHISQEEGEVLGVFDVCLLVWDVSPAENCIQFV